MYLSRSTIDKTSTAANVTMSFSKNRKKKSMISATTLFQIGGIVNSCHSGSGGTLFGVVVAVWVGVGVLVELFPEKSKQF